MAILEITVVPVGTAGSSLTEHLAGIPDLLRQSGLRHHMHPMGTVVEGGVAELFALAARIHEAGFGAGCRRVFTHLSVDDRRDVERPMEEKVRRLQDAGRRGTA